MKIKTVRLSAPIITLALCLSFALQAAESSNPPLYYPEFKATMGMINNLHKLVNETDIEVKSASHKRNGSLLLECHPDWNTTNQGLVAYFEEEHLTKVYTPFGSLMIFWLTRADKKWNPVLEKFKETCTLREKTFSTRFYDVKDSYPVLSINDVSLRGPGMQPTRIMQGDQKRQEMLSACIKHYLQDGGTLTELESLGKRKKRLAEQRQAQAAQQSHWRSPLDLLFNMFDLSN